MRYKNFLFLSVFLLISLFCQAQFRTKTAYLKYEEYDRTYEFYVPENYSKNQIYPIVLILHGGGGTAKGLVRNTRARFNFLANRDKFIAVYPNGVEKGWNDSARDTFGVARKINIDDVEFIKKVIQNLNSKVNVDMKNIFACGISNGGFMSQRLAFELSDKIKGIGVVAANLSEEQAKKESPENPVPVIFINGTHDPLVPFNGGEINVLGQKRGKVLSVEESIKAWTEINNCTEKTEQISIPDINKRDKCTVEKTVYQNPENPKIKVVAIKIEGGGHTWPKSKQYLPRKLVGNTNNDFFGCDEIWSFFKALID